jgi:enoyl-CoA hydratase/carnithine racemase
VFCAGANIHARSSTHAFKVNFCKSPTTRLAIEDARRVGAKYLAALNGVRRRGVRAGAACDEIVLWTTATAVSLPEVPLLGSFPDRRSHRLVTAQGPRDLADMFAPWPRGGEARGRLNLVDEVARSRFARPSRRAKARPRVAQARGPGFPLAARATREGDTIRWEHVTLAIDRAC